MKNEISIEEMHKIEMDIISEFDSICLDNNIKYFLGYGSCIGAIRHSGFIPWDDDIDVVMLYEDYKKLIDYYRNNNNGRYKMLCYELGTTSSIPYAKIIDSNTVLDEYETTSEPLGVYIDIFPLYYLPDKEILRKILYFKMKFLDLFYTCSRKKSVKGKNIIRTFAQVLIKPVSLFIGEKRLNTIIINTIKRNTVNHSNYVSILPPSYGNREILSAEYFKGTVYKNFEHLKLPVPIEYDKYLKQIYGEYMTLPPIDKQVTHHKYYVEYKK